MLPFRCGTLASALPSAETVEPRGGAAGLTSLPGKGLECNSWRRHRFRSLPILGLRKLMPVMGRDVYAAIN